MTGKEVVAHLDRDFRPVKYDAKFDLDNLVKDFKKKKIDVVFNALHGTDGEDGKIQGLFETYGIPYTGSGVLSSAMCFDKAVTKRIYCMSGIPSPKGLRLTKEQWKRHKVHLKKIIKKKLGNKIVVKPNASGSSVGVSVLPPLKDWEKAIQKAFREDKESVLIEEAVSGRELTVAVLEDKKGLLGLPVIEICASEKFFDYKAKYSGKSKEICPADIPDYIATHAQDLAMAAHKALRCSGYSRTEMIWHGGRIDVLETNTLPGLTKMSLFPQAAAAADIPFPKLLSQLITRALE
jgi:D-alanine-D-alanine ligase